MSAPTGPDRVERSFPAVLAGLMALAAILLWSPRFLPMVDLPQHAAQVAIWTHLDDPAFRFAEQPLVFNWLTPYLLGYSIARLLALALPVFVAMKLTVTLAVLALPLALLALLRAAGADRWWALLALPLAFGFSFLWGFVNFLVAAPVGLLLVAAAHRAAARWSAPRALGIAGLALLTFFGHAAVLGLCGLAAALVLLRSTPSRTAGLLRVLPLAAPVPLLVLWLAASLGGEAQARVPFEWAAAWKRPLQLPPLLLGLPTDRLAAGAVVALAGVLALLGVRLRAWRENWPAPVVALLAFFTAPSFGLGVAMLYQRLAIFVGLFLPLVLALPAAPRRRTAARAALILFVASWLAVLAVRFTEFDRDARGIEPLIAAAEPGLTVRGLVFGAEHPAFRGLPLFLHFPAWYQVEKGGAQAFSFAQYFPELVRYERTPEWAVPLGFEAAPERFVWARDWRLYDAYIVRAKADPAPRLFPGAGPELAFAAREGNWWLFLRRPPIGGPP